MRRKDGSKVPSSLTRWGSPSTRQDQALQARQDTKGRQELTLASKRTCWSVFWQRSPASWDKPDSRTGDVRSSRTVTRRGREITCGSPSDGLTPHWPDVSPNASIPSRGEDGRSPRVTARISLDSACLGLSIPSHCAASKPALSPCRPVTVTLSPKRRQFGLMDALDALDAGCTQMHSAALGITTRK